MKKSAMPDSKYLFRAGRKQEPNKLECIGEIPESVKEIAKDFTVVGNVRVEKEFDTDGTYVVNISPKPVKIDIDLLYTAMKKHSIEGFFIDGNPVKNFFFNIVTS